MMNLVLPLAISFGLATFLAGCGSSSKSTTNSYRKLDSAYQIWEADKIRLKPIKRVQLENGLKIIYIYDESLPKLGMTWLGQVGVLQESQNLRGLNSLTANLLPEGTQSKSVVQINEELSALGSQIDVSASSELTEVSIDVLSIHRDEALELLSDVLLNPSFPEKEVQRIKQNVEAGLKKVVDNPSSLVSEKSALWYFGGHPFSVGPGGNLESLQKIQREQILKHYQEWYRPNNSTLAVYGKFDAEFESRIQSTFSAWKKRDLQVLPAAQKITPPQKPTEVATKEKLKQSEVRFFLPGIPRNHPDIFPLRLATQVLGGGMSSQLYSKIRGELGLTYSISAGQSNYKDLGVIRISSFSKNESIQKLVDETQKVVTNFWQNGITAEELASAKQQLIGQFPQIIETPDRVAFNIMALEYFGLDPKNLLTYTKDVDAVTLQQVNAVIKKYYDPQQLRTFLLTPSL